ncbi:MAG: cytochrome c-type biogenesis protein CcmH [Myxococcota bacterium]
MRRVSSRVCFVSTLLAALFFCAAAQAAETPAEPPDWAYGIAHELLSPFCPGVSLAECPSPEAYELRLWILTQATAGAPREEVEAALYERFGDKIRGTPRAEGWGLAAYLIPLAAFVLGGAIVVQSLRRMVRPRVEAAATLPVTVPPAPIDPELERRVDRDLQRG